MLAYCGHTMRKQGSCLEKDACRRGRPRSAWMDNIKMWTGLSVEESIRMTEDRENGESTSIVWPALVSRTAKEQNRTCFVISTYPLLRLFPCPSSNSSCPHPFALSFHSSPFFSYTIPLKSSAEVWGNAERYALIQRALATAVRHMAFMLCGRRR